MLTMVIYEFQQNNVLIWFEDSINNAKTYAPGLNLDYIPIELGNDDSINIINVCKGFNQSATFVIDVSLEPNDDIEKVCVAVGSPYIKIDLSISPILKLLDKYLHLRNSTDVAIIFENSLCKFREDLTIQKFYGFKSLTTCKSLAIKFLNVDEALYYWIDSTTLRLLITENIDEVTAKRFKTMRPTPSNFAIISSSSKMETILKKVMGEALVKIPERWILVFQDFDFLEFDKELLNAEPVNILTFDVTMCCRLQDTENCSCPKNFHMYQKYFETVSELIFRSLLSAKNKFDFSKKYSCDNPKYENETRDEFRNQFSAYLALKNIMYLVKDEVKLKVIGNIDTINKTKQLTRLATYSDQGGMKVTKGIEVKKITPFFRVGMTNAIPWSFKEKDRKSGKMQWTGYCVDFIKKLSETMGFNYQIVEPKSGSFGEKHPDGYWDGVIGDLARGETDIGLTALTMTADREEVVDFVAPYFEQSGITIVMRKPVRKTSLFKFMTVLKLEVWLSIVGALVVTGIMIWFLDKYSPYSARNNKKAYPYPCRDFTLKESFWFALTSFTPQGGGEAPKALSGRTLVAAYWLFVVLMLATFTANLAAFLTVERMQTPVQSLEQLARQSRINYTVVFNSDSHNYFINMKNAEDTLYRLWKELTLNASTDETQYRVWDYPIREQYGHILIAINDSMPVKDAAEGFRKVNEHLDADYAFIHDSSEIKYEISRNCNFTEVGNVFAEKPYAVAVQQGSHLQDLISSTILDLQKDRFFEYLQSKYWNNSLKGECSNTDDSEGITLESLGGVFIATLFGLALAMITLAGEVLYYKKQKRKIRVQKVASHWNNKRMEKNQGLNSPQTITIGTTFNPVKPKNLVNVSYPDLYPKSRISITRVT